MKFRIVIWDVLPCKIIVGRRVRGTGCLHHPWLWRQYQPPLKRRSTIILHGSTSQKTILNLIDWLIDHVDGVRLSSQYCGHQLAYCSSPWWYVSVVSHGEDDAGWGKPLTHEPEVAENPTSRHLGTSRRNGRRSEKFAYQYLRHVKGSLTCRNILRRGISTFTSHPKEGVLRFFIALNIHRLDRVWIRDPWVRWQAHWPLNHLGDQRTSFGLVLYVYQHDSFTFLDNNCTKSHCWSRLLCKDGTLIQLEQRWPNVVVKTYCCALVCWDHSAITTQGTTICRITLVQQCYKWCSVKNAFGMYAYSKSTPIPEVLKLSGAPLGALLVLWGARVCMRDIYLEWNMGTR
jgi:hypothetical protein